MRFKFKKKIDFRPVLSQTPKLPAKRKIRSTQITAIFTSGAGFEHHVSGDQIKGGLKPFSYQFFSPTKIRSLDLLILLNNTCNETMVQNLSIQYTQGTITSAK